MKIDPLRAHMASIGRLGGAVKGFKEGMKGAEDKAAEIPPSTGQTIDAEVRKETTKS